jgi:RNA polymerase sigma-70 factor (ECF subfamily)
VPAESTNAEARMSASSSRPAAPACASGEAAESCDVRIRVQRLYQEHSSSLVRQLTRKTGSRELACELANESFLRLLRMAPGDLSRIQHPEAFLRQISMNLLRDWVRAKTLRERSRPALELASDQQLDQITALESRDTLRRLERAMGKLKPRTREIFLAHRIHGFSYAEIAERTGLSVKGVEKQMSKAIAKIDRLMDRG